MANYIDAFALPIPRAHLDTYKKAASQVATIWKEYGALEYHEYLGKDLALAGTRSFPDAVNAGADDAVIFGWTVFATKEDRDRANAQVKNDPRMAAIVGPLVDPSEPIFDPQKMVYGGFETLV